MTVKKTESSIFDVFVSFEKSEKLLKMIDFSSENFLLIFEESKGFLS